MPPASDDEEDDVREVMMLSVGRDSTTSRRSVGVSSTAVNERSSLLPNDHLQPPDGHAAQEEDGDLQTRPYLGYLVVLLCLVGFAFSMWKNNWRFEPLQVNPLIGPSPEALVLSGAKDEPRIVLDNEWWRLVTQLFLHGGLVHLLVNMSVLWKYGFRLELEAGSLRFLAIYSASGLLAGIASCAFIPSIISVGASGAIFGLMGAMWGDYLQNWKMLVERSGCCTCGLALLTLVLSSAINLAMGLLPFVDNFAHAFGMVGGLLMGSVVMIRPRAEGVSCCQRTWAVTALLIYLALVAYGVLSMEFGWSQYEWCPWCDYISCIPTRYWNCTSEAVNRDGKPVDGGVAAGNGTEQAGQLPLAAEVLQQGLQLVVNALWDQQVDAAGEAAPPLWHGLRSE